MTNPLILQAKRLCGVSTHHELKYIFSLGLGNTWQGRKILNDKSVSMETIEKMRQAVDDLEGSC